MGYKRSVHDSINSLSRNIEGAKFIVHYSNDGIDSGAMLAFLLIAAGALLLSFNFGMFAPVWKSFFFSWPMLVFVIGAICICRWHIITGVVAGAVGVFYLIGKAAPIYPHDIQVESLMSNFWPAVFIVSGIVIILSFIFRSKCRRRHPKGNWYDDYVPTESENNDGKINYRFVFSGTEQVILDPVFKGGSIETIFGGLELDLRRTTLAEGTTTLYINTVFGGVEIKAPDTWDIEIRSKSVAGGVADQRKNLTDIDRTRKLVLIAKCTIGGVTII
jgi:predicted membrane protein